jgi:hypothetical protein
MFLRELLGHACRSYQGAMFRIVLQPDEQALLSAIQAGLCRPGMVPGPLLLKFMALRMVVCDEHGYPRLTDLAEAALARMRGRVH